MAGCNCAAIRPRRLVEQEPATSPPFVPGLHRAHATNPFHSHSSDPPHAAAPSLHNTPHRHHHCTPAKPSGLGIRFPARSTRALLSSSSPSLLVGACPNPSERDCSAGAGGGGPALFMKVLCSACEAAEASVLCCADDAALCARCDRDVHAANRLAGKHQRLPLLAPGAQSAAAAVSPPKCDICQECDAYFFCLEDRALLCRSCDVAVHTANAFVSAHRRFLLTGVQVGKELDDPAPEQPEPPPPPPPQPAKSDPAPPPLYSDSDFAWAAGVTETLADWSAVSDQFPPSPAPRHAEPASRATPPKRSPRAPAFAAGQGRVAGGVMDWPLGEFFRGVSDFNGGGFSFGESGTSKADSAKLGGSAGGSPYYRSSSEDREANELFGQVPEIQWSVPELPSPPTASGLHWQHGGGGGGPDSTAFVPDICSPDSAVRRCFPTAAAAAAKRQRNR